MRLNRVFDRLARRVHLAGNGLTVLIASIFVVTLTSCSESEVNYQTFVDNGSRYFDEGQFRAAIIEASNALQQNPTRPEANFLLARIYHALGQGRQASDYLDLSRREGIEYHGLQIRNSLLMRKFGTALVMLNTNKKEFLDEDPLTFHLLNAQARAAMKQFAEAKSHYGSMLLIESANADALLGQAYLEAVVEGDLFNAELKVEGVLTRDPTNSDALILSAQLRAGTGDLEGAAQALTETISILPATDIFTPQRSRLLVLLSSVLTQQGRTAEALVYTQLLDDAFPQALEKEERYLEAIAEIQKGNFERAEKTLKELLADAPGAIEPATMLGVVSYIRGDLSRAEEYFANSVDPESASDMAIRYFAVSRLRLNRPQQVMSLLKNRVGDTKDVSTLALYAIAAMSAGQIEESRAVLQRALLYDPENSRLRLLMAKTYAEDNPEMRLGELRMALELQPSDTLAQAELLQELVNIEQFDAAGVLIDRLIADFPDQPSSYVLASVFHSAQRRPRDALAALNQALEISDENVTVLFALGATYARIQDWSGAESTYRKVLDIDGNNATAYQGLLSVYAVQNRLAEGVKLLQSMGKEIGSEIPVLVISDFYRSRNQVDQSIVYLDLAEQQNPDSEYAKRVRANVYYNKARRALGENDFKQARTAVFSALSSLPKNTAVLAMLARVEIASGSFGEARKLVQEIRKIHPSLNLADVIDGDLHIALGNVTNAIASYREAWRIQANDSVAVKLSTLLIQSGEHAAFEAFRGEWLAQSPDSRSLRIATATQLASVGRDAEAIKVYEDLVALDPSAASPTILNNLAWLHANSGNLGNALVHAREAYKQLPTNADVVDTYGWLLYLDGEYAEAVTILENAVKMAPGESEILGHLTRAQRALSEG